MTPLLPHLYLLALALASVLLSNTGNKVKLDGVGPVDNRPSTDRLHHFVQKKRKRKKRRRKKEEKNCDL